jgi:hypothetical protein
MANFPAPQLEVTAKQEGDRATFFEKRVVYFLISAGKF